MAFAQGARSQLALVSETVFGTTPGTPSMEVIPYNTHSLDLAKERVQGNEIIADRMPRVDRHGNRTVSGDIVCELRDTDFDKLFESAFFSTFDTNGVLEVGTTPSFLTIEDGALDIAQYRVFTGCAVNTMAISLQQNQMVLGTFGMVGKNMSMSTSPLDASPDAPSGGEPFDTYSGTLSEGGSAIAVLSGIDFTLDNQLAPTFVLGADTTPQLEFGRSLVSGTMTAYFQNASLIEKFLNETETSLSIVLDDPTTGGSYTFLMPRVKLNGAAVPVGSPQSRLITIPFIALYDTDEETILRLTKAA